MAKKSSDENTSDKLLWLAGGAIITAGVMYYVNRHLKEREELNELRFAERQQRLKEGGGE